MIKHFRVLLAAFAALVMVGCSKEKSIDSTASGGRGLLRMKIDGVQWTANKAVAASIMNGYLVIAGTSTDGKEFSIQLELAGTGVYQLDQSSINVATLTDNAETPAEPYLTNQGQDANDAGGTVTLTAIDEGSKRVSGTFAFAMYRDYDDKQLVITEGYFEGIPYASEDGPSGGGGTGSMSAKINGNSWSASTFAASSDLGLITLMGSSGTDLASLKMVTIAFPESTTPGTYAFGSSSAMAGYMESGISYSAESGELVITEHNTSGKTIKGSFKFEAKEGGGTNTISFTEGSFSATYQ